MLIALSMFQEYFNTIKELYASGEESSEHTYRSALETLLNAFIEKYTGRKLTVRHEPVRQGNAGRPDFKISTPEQLTIGLLETKKIGEDLKKHLNSDQLKKYAKFSENIILTDYLHFYLIRKGEPVLDVLLFSEYHLEKKSFKLKEYRVAVLERLLTDFFESEPETICKTHDLARKLSDKARFLKEYCRSELEREADRNSVLEAIYQAFKETLLPSLTRKYFSDIYAQTLSYALFLSALNSDSPKQQLTKYSANELLPGAFPLIKELFHSLDNFPQDINWVIEEIITILKATDFPAIKKEFAEYRRKKSGFADPFIFFYEDFLYHYDPGQRKIRGVYYTPEPVVSFITRSVEIIVKETFDLKDGLINKDVTLLDFAAGTGTFLLNAFKLALEETMKRVDKITANKILNEIIIKNFYGFELLAAPYAVANLKISEYLKDWGFSINEGNRLNIFLTNTLSNKEPKPFGFLPHLSKEGLMANEIKNKDILIIMGNPPYSVSSANKTGFIAEEKMQKYKKAVVGEKNIQPLSDDYIKFIRFAHWKMENAEKGVVGIISNNSFIDGLIHRGMREELLKDFDEIYILNLHGSSRIGEITPEGKKDENIFAIMQGVAISIFVKKEKKSNRNPEVYFADLYGTKDEKLDFLQRNDIRTLLPKTNKEKQDIKKWTKLNPQKEFYFFARKDFKSKKKYEKGFKIDEIFNKYSSGVKTHRDHFVVAYNKNTLKKRLIRFYSLTKENASNEFDLKNTRDWKIERALKEGSFGQDFIKEYAYRPFDIRFIYYDLNILERGTNRFNIMKHMMQPNIGLSTTRSQAKGHNNFLVTDRISDLRFSSRPGSIGSDYLFPLFIYNGEELKKSGGYVEEPAIPYEGRNELEKIPNFSKDFIKFIELKYKDKYSPEQILGYIYAILYSPAYREKYIEFLKIDFPRVPFCDDEELFKKLSETGYDLIEHHLMEKSYDNPKCSFKGEGDNFLVEKITYEKGKVYINKNRYFEDVPEDLWNFRIGGYQVLEKWLKERRKHEINLEGDDILHFIKITNILESTIQIMNEINELTEKWI